MLRLPSRDFVDHRLGTRFLPLRAATIRRFFSVRFCCTGSLYIIPDIAISIRVRYADRSAQSLDHVRPPSSLYWQTACPCTVIVRDSAADIIVRFVGNAWMGYTPAPYGLSMPKIEGATNLSYPYTR